MLLYLGRLAREKNVEELFAVAAALGETATLLLVGDGPDRMRLETLAAGLPNVVFAGMARPDTVPLYYALGDIFVSASTSETQGLTYCEALAAGLPAVCRADACLNGVIRDGCNGWQYRTPAELETRLRTLLANPDARARMAAAARAGAAAFDETTFGERAAALYRRLIWQREKTALPRKGITLWNV